MKKVALLISLLIVTPVAVFAATVNQNCTPTVQAIGACNPADSGKPGIVLAYWVSLEDKDPSAEVQSDALDFRDATCWRMGIELENCTKEQVDGYWRRLMVETVQSYRRHQKELNLSPSPEPTMDGQGN